MALAGAAFPAVDFPPPSAYTFLADDPTDVNNDCNNPNKASQSYRDLDKVYIYDDQTNQRIFIRYEYYGLTGFPSAGTGIHKWAIDTGGRQITYQSFDSGTQILNHEYLLFVWDKGGAQNRLGEVNLAYQGPDGAEDGYPDTVVIGPTTACGSACVGTGSTALGGLQMANNSPDIGYRLQGKVAELYVSYAALGSTDGTNPVRGLFELCPIGVGESTATNGNLDQASACDSTVNAIGNIELGIVCGSEPAALTIVKDTVDDLPTAEFNFAVEGRSEPSAILQDPGASECVDPNEWAECGEVPPWDREDRVSFEDLEGSNHHFESPIPYRVIESAGSGATFEAFTTTWECRNVDPTLCTPELLSDPLAVPDPFATAACAAVDPLVRCEASGWDGGVAMGEGPVTDFFDICMSAHVVCKFTNTSQQCPAAQTAVGDLKALGAVENKPIGFATSTVPLRSRDTADSIFLASFIPLAEGSRWPGDLDHYILPLPVVENDVGQLVADPTVTCADAEDTGCLAWRAGTAILGQAPTAGEVTTDRRIGLDENERRVTYTTNIGSGVPRAIRAFDWTDSDALADEYDLWDGFEIPYVAGDTTSEAEARALAHATINETLRIRQTTITNPDLPTGSLTIDFVAGDFFHGDPVIVASQNFYYLANDLEGNGAACDDTTTPNRGYRCFFEKTQYRRRVIVAASNDGQVHGFDAGQFVSDVVSQKLQGEFTFGTGKEVFAHVTRPMLAHTQRMTTDEHHFGVDGGLLVDDVFIDPSHSGTPDPDQREWRTVVFGTYREGGRGVFALDVTQPDPVDKVNILDFAGQADTAWVPDPEGGVVPECAALGGSPDDGCGTLSYPAQLWEFDDTCLDSSSSLTVGCDEDSNGKTDLGHSWSQINTGRILVNVQGEDDPVVKFVALFGGGLDHDDKVGIGNWIYMVDIETGKAIYKRPVASAVPSEPAAVDTNQDGFLDTLYVGTTGGLLYKVDLSTPADVDPTTGRLDNATQWAPFAIFDTEGRPIYYPPTVTFVANQGKYALAFGTGDREDLYSPVLAGQDGRFYLILDPGFQPGTGVLTGGPLTEASFQQIEALGEGVSGDFLTAPLVGRQPGWVLHLAPNERVVTKALLLSGLLVFSTFHPVSPDLCEFSGNGSVYALLATNANSIAGPDEDRAVTIEGFAARAVVMPTGMTTRGEGGTELDPFLAARVQGIRDNLMDLFPADCRFGSFSLNVSVTLSNTSVLPVASVPICVARKNWTEH